MGIAIQHKTAHTPEYTKIYQTDNATLCCGNALEILPLIEPESIDALITDPPYSSGATHKAGRTNQGSHAKYLNDKNLHRFDGFAGENMDGTGIPRSQAGRLCPGVYCLAATASFNRCVSGQRLYMAWNHCVEQREGVTNTPYRVFPASVRIHRLGQ